MVTKSNVVCLAAASVVEVDGHDDELGDNGEVSCNKRQLQEGRHVVSPECHAGRSGKVAISEVPAVGESTDFVAILPSVM